MYNAIDIHGELRVEVEAAIATQITSALAKKHIIVEAFILQDVRLPASLVILLDVEYWAPST